MGSTAAAAVDGVNGCSSGWGQQPQWVGSTAAAAAVDGVARGIIISKIIGVVFCEVDQMKRPLSDVGQSKASSRGPPMAKQQPRVSSGDARQVALRLAKRRRAAQRCDASLNSCQVASGAEERPLVMFLCSPFDVLKRRPLLIKLPLASTLISLAAAAWLPVS